MAKRKSTKERSKCARLECVRSWVQAPIGSRLECVRSWVQAPIGSRLESVRSWVQAPIGSRLESVRSRVQDRSVLASGVLDRGFKPRSVLASSVLDRGFKPRSVLASSVLDRGFKTDRFKLKTMKFVFSTSLLVVICTDCIGSCKSNYHTITTPTASYRYLISGYKCKQNDGKCKDNIQCIPLTRFCDTDSETYHCEDRSDKDPDICRSKCKIIYNIRDRPFNLQGFFFAQKFFFGQHELEFFFWRNAQFFSLQNLTLGYMSKTLNQIFFSSTKIRIFF